MRHTYLAPTNPSPTTPVRTLLLPHQPSRSGRIYVEGQVRNASPFITKIGNFDVELSVLGSVLLTRQVRIRMTAPEQVHGAWARAAAGTASSGALYAASHCYYELYLLASEL